MSKTTMEARDELCNAILLLFGHFACLLGLTNMPCGPQAQLSRIRMRGPSLTISSLPTGSRQDGRNTNDARAIANRLDQLPYHSAWYHCPSETQHALNPHLPIDMASELADGWQQGG